MGFLTNPEHRLHMTRFEELRKALVQAQALRQWMPMEDDKTPYWNTYEMLTVWGLVNQFRKALDKGPVLWENVVRVEQMAAGHVDYTKKFALYCAELVLED